MKREESTGYGWFGNWRLGVVFTIAWVINTITWGQSDSAKTPASLDCDTLARRVMRGEVIAPDTGVFAWYDLQDIRSGDVLFLRQAVVGTDRKKNAEGVWLETEVVPRIGFPVLYKVLIEARGDRAGRILGGQIREGYDPPQPLDVNNADTLPTGDLSGGQLELAGTETVQTPAGNIDTCHVKVTRQDGKTIELWLAPDVTPAGIVRMRTEEGEMKLRFCGRGGADGSSAMDRPPPFDSNVSTRVTTQSGTIVESPPPGSPAASEAPGVPEKVRKNFNKRNP